MIELYSSRSITVVWNSDFKVEASEIIVPFFLRVWFDQRSFDQIETFKLVEDFLED